MPRKLDNESLCLRRSKFDNLKKKIVIFDIDVAATQDFLVDE